MKRRIFIATAFLSGLTADTLFASSFVRTITVRKFETFLQAVNAFSAQKLFLSDPSLDNAYQETGKNWFKSGFSAYGTDYYLCQNNQLALFPIEFSHTTLGQIDFAVLCFAKDKQGDWHHVQPLSGFHIETLAKAANDLPFKELVNLENYFLPTIKKINMPFSFSTENGYIQCKIVMKEAQTTIEASIFEGSRVIWQKQFFSEHTLQVQSLLS